LINEVDLIDALERKGNIFPHIGALGNIGRSLYTSEVLLDFAA
jgi:hypothetical protein